ncbi:hypothetical protein MBLNU459_g4094t2 [Dothideomycetes sp. NU459]
MYNLSALLVPWAYLTTCVQATSQVVLGNNDEATASATPFNKAFDDYVERIMADWHVPGVAIAVVHENQTWAKGYGFATLPDEPVTPHTLFQGASTTKSFTASLAALLVDDNTTHKDIKWTSRLHDLIGNDFVLEDAYTTTHVTLEDALSHRTGFPRHDIAWLNQELDTKGTAHMLRHLTPSAEFRTKWQYNNMMFTAVSHFIESVTGMWQGDVLRKWLWEPLGMSETYYSYDEAFGCEETNAECRMAASYVWDDESSKYHEVPLSDFAAANGAGGIISNVLDYSQWVRALMYESGPVSKDSHKALKSPLSIVNVEDEPYSGPTWYGMGLDAGVYRGERVFGHDGGIGGYLSRFSFLPDRKFGYVVFTNGYGFVMDIAGWRLMDEFLGTPRDEFAKVDEKFHKLIEQQKEKVKALPSELYPDVPTRRIAPAVKLQEYEGTYHHAGYGNVSLSLSAPRSSAVHTSSPSMASGLAGSRLYAHIKYENILLTLHHVSGEHWLVEYRSHVHNTTYPKNVGQAKFEVGANGLVEKVALTPEDSVQGDARWVWFARVA